MTNANSPEQAKGRGPNDFDQRLNATFSAHGNTIAAEFEAGHEVTHEMKPDFSVTYTRVTRR
jgi:hypothetical protein